MVDITKLFRGFLSPYIFFLFCFVFMLRIRNVYHKKNDRLKRLVKEKKTSLVEY